MQLRSTLGIFVYLCLTITAPLAAQTVREKLFADGEFFDVDKHAAFILWPAAGLRASPQPWVFYAPTLDAYPDTHEEWMHRQFLDAGIAVAGIDVGEAYGSPASRKLFDRFYDELTVKRKFSTKPVLLGRSRGGLWVSSWACDHPERFAGLAGIYPVYDWRTYPGVEKAAAAYGLSADEMSSRISELNPIARVDALAKARLPVFIIHGDQDVVVPLGPNSQSLADRYKANDAAGAMELKVVAGQGHNFWPGFFKCQELVDFVIKHAKN